MCRSFYEWAGSFLELFGCCPVYLVCSEDIQLFLPQLMSSGVTGCRAVTLVASAVGFNFASSVPEEGPFIFPYLSESIPDFNQGKGEDALSWQSSTDSFCLLQDCDSTNLTPKRFVTPAKSPAFPPSSRIIEYLPSVFPPTFRTLRTS